MKVTIYGLHCPLAGYVKYVGKAVNVIYRFNRHLGPETFKEETHKTRWIRKLLALGLSPELVILEETDEEHWVEREKWWIAHYRSQGITLTNSTDGGEGAAFGSKRPPEHCKKISDGMIGRVVSQETRSKISAAHKGVKMTPERVQKTALALRDRASKMTPEERKEMASRMYKNPEKWRKNHLAALAPGRRKTAGSSSRFFGVYYNSRPGRQKRWVAKIHGSQSRGEKQINIGYFATEIEAAVAYNEAVLKHKGPDYPLNKIPPHEVAGQFLLWTQ